MSRVDADKLLADMNEGRILSQQTFEGLDVEAYLDQRDASEFADEWMQGTGFQTNDCSCGRS
ncbi:hypothetical protein ACFVQB_03385 [Paenibacillus sp. NPDC057886]|uniref:hypothetical protein n=1 Tax=Paenibacillus sp. NPDC057886 TaxID=3346270 RepID=UPI00368BCA3B